MWYCPPPYVIRDQLRDSIGLWPSLYSEIATKILTIICFYSGSQREEVAAMQAATQIPDLSQAFMAWHDTCRI